MYSSYSAIVKNVFVNLEHFYEEWFASLALPTVRSPIRVLFTTKTWFDPNLPYADHRRTLLQPLLESVPNNYYAIVQPKAVNNRVYGAMR